MPKRVAEKVSFLDDEIRAIKQRMGGTGNAVQLARLDMWQDIRDDYCKSLEKSNANAPVQSQARQERA